MQYLGIGGAAVHGFGDQRQIERLAVRRAQHAIVAVGVTGLLHQLLGAIQVEVVAAFRFRLRVIAHHTGADGAAAELVGAIGDDLCDLFTIDGKVECLAHAHVVKGRNVILHVDQPHLTKWRCLDSHARFFQDRHVQRIGDTVHEVDIARLQGGDPRCFFRQDAEFDAVEVVGSGIGAFEELRPPVVFVPALQGNPFAWPHVDDLVGTCPDRVQFILRPQLFDRTL